MQGLTAFDPAAVRPQDIEAVQQTVAEVAPNVQPPAPTWGEYLISLVGRFASWLGDLIGLGGPALARLFQVLGWLLIATTIVLVVIFCVRLLLRRRASTGGETIERRQTHSQSQEPTAEELRLRIDRLLAGGKSSGALTVMWVWLATRLRVYSSSEMSWTGRELIRAAQRPDLLPLVRSLERITYGPGGAGYEDTKQIWKALLERLPGEVA